MGIFRMRNYVLAFAPFLLFSLLLSLTGTTAIADQAVGCSDNPQAYSSQSRYTNQVFWWTPPNGADDVGQYLAEGKTHSSVDTVTLPDGSELKVDCAISNLGNKDGKAGAAGLITKIPSATGTGGPYNLRQGGYKGDGLSFLYNSGTTGDNNTLANGLLFGSAEEGTINPIWREGVLEFLNAYNASDEEKQSALYSWYWDFLQNGGGSANLTPAITKDPVVATETEFDFTCTVTANGQVVPFSYVVADAESIATLDGYVGRALDYGASSGGTLENPSINSDYYRRKEWMDLTAYGSGARWHISEQYTGCQYSSQVTMLSNEKLRLHGQEGECPGWSKGPAGVVLASDSDYVHVKMHNRSKPNGQDVSYSVSAVAVGIHLAGDFGDAPNSYGGAGQLWQPTWSDSLDAGVDSRVSALTTPEATAQTNGGTANGGTYSIGARPQDNFYLGSKRDLDVWSGNGASTGANGDDSTAGDGYSGNDEDGFSSGTDISTTVSTSDGLTTYTLSVPCTANGGTGYVGGWIDWNMDGVFEDDGEEAQAVCTGGTAQLMWTMPSNKVEPWLARTGANYDTETSYLRLRISPNSEHAYSPTGIFASEGEVEDHKITWDTPVSISKQASIEDGKDAVAGTRITWSVELDNTGNIDYTNEFPMSFTDDLSDILAIIDPATLQVEDAAGGTLTLPTGSDTQLTWTGGVQSGEETLTVSYSATIQNYDDGIAHNSVATIREPNNPATSETPLSLITVTKVADKEQVSLYGSISYTVTITNEGEGDALYASAIDDLSGVLDDTSFVETSLSASVGSASRQGDEIHWSGALPAGESAAITYTVTVDTDEGDRSADNTVTVSDTFADVASRQTASTSTPIYVPPVTGVSGTSQRIPILPLLGAGLGGFAGLRLSQRR